MGFVDDHEFCLLGSLILGVHRLGPGKGKPSRQRELGKKMLIKGFSTVLGDRAILWHYQEALPRIESVLAIAAFEEAP